jgi:hypothetical protein
MSDGEKLAWAEQAGVTPPSYVMAAAAQKLLAEETNEADASSCCASKAAVCCAEHKSCGDSLPSERACASPPLKRGVGFVFLHAAMKCRGLTVSVALLPPSLPAPSADFMPAPIERFLTPVDESLLYDAPHLAVEPPPPDAARA